MSDAPRMKLADAAGYAVPPGGTLVRLRDLDRTYRARLIEIRDAVTGTGTAGRLVDANHYLFEETVAIRFEGERLGMFADPEDVVLVWPDGATEADIVRYHEQAEP